MTQLAVQEAAKEQAAHRECPDDAARMFESLSLVMSLAVVETEPAMRQRVDEILTEFMRREASTGG